jgi:cob(I)alamin adenosyltransferase
MAKQSIPGLVIVYTGNGKGKTTAALGLAWRALSHGQRVVMVQFVKSPRASGEMKLIRDGWPNFKVSAYGLGFVGIMQDRLNRSQHKIAAQKALAAAQRAARRCDVLILDEINGAMHGGLISQRDVLRFIIAKPKKLTLVLTGRQAPVAIIRRADLVTEMIEVKHPFRHGRVAEAGIDF